MFYKAIESKSIDKMVPKQVRWAHVPRVIDRDWSMLFLMTCIYTCRSTDGSLEHLGQVLVLV